MEITLNGQAREVPAATTARQLIAMLDLEGRRLAMEINQEVVPRSRLDELQLQQGDCIEIVHAIGGG
jgi:sulfur carrier protein